MDADLCSMVGMAKLSGIRKWFRSLVCLVAASPGPLSSRAPEASRISHYPFPISHFLFGVKMRLISFYVHKQL